MTQANSLLSHRTDANFDKAAHLERIRSAPSLSIPTEQALEWVEDLAGFELGRFLLAHRGLNGYWTAYIILHAPKRSNLTTMEDWLIHKCPVIRATRERFHIFRKHLQALLRDNVSVASIPCGLMDDLLGLDYSVFKGIKLTGIDLDTDSLAAAQENASLHGHTNVSFLHKDAWALELHGAFDLITSNGLNLYAKSTDKVIALYQSLFDSLKPGGTLVTSFLTPPPTLSEASPWRDVPRDDALKQAILLGEIVGAGWQRFYTEAETRAQLESVGFGVEAIEYDAQAMFPTVVCVKPS